MKTTELKKILSKPFGKIVLVDLDNTLCDGTYWVGDTTHPPVNEKMQKLVWELDDKGAFIIIWTARPLKAMNATYKWLGQNNLQYPLACRIKCPCDIMIDDKVINATDLISEL